MGWQEQLRAQRAATEHWIRARNAQVAKAAHDLEARGRKVYADAIRRGERVIARTPNEVKQLALAAATGQLPQQVVTMAARKAAPTVKRVIAEAQTPAGRVRLVENAKQQGRAAASGAVDEASFGGADIVLSAAEALVDGGPEGFSRRYDAELAG